MSNLYIPPETKSLLSSRGVDDALWLTLKNSIFPGAENESIISAIDYCRARKLDVLKKPCHIVPMKVKDSETGKYYFRDVIMPGIYEQRITAFRTQQMAGQDDPVFGETINYLGVEAPEWCRVTVYRFINGTRCAFSHTEYFKESCAVTSDGKVNYMWTKRPRGQLAKCAEAGALRKAFPDELGGVITADEITEEVKEKDVTPQKTVIDAEVDEVISDEKISEIKFLLDATKSDIERFKTHLNIESIETMKQSQYETAIELLNKKVDTQQKRLQEAQESHEEVVSL